MNNPLVSIIIPVYNGANYLKEAIDSALAQTYSNIEILVINDGSNDNDATHKIATSYGDKIRYFYKDNGGVVSALNYGIDNMNGEYFSWLSHDDLYLPQKIEKQITALLENESERYLFCVCSCIYIDENSNEKYKGKKFEVDTFRKNPQCTLLLGEASFNGIMVLIPKILFDICGKFSTSLATHEYDMWLRLMKVADIRVVSEYLALYRIHNKQIRYLKKVESDNEIDNFLTLKIDEIPLEEFNEFWIDMLNNNHLYLYNFFKYRINTLPLTCYEVNKRLSLKLFLNYINILGVLIDNYHEDIKCLNSSISNVSICNNNLYEKINYLTESNNELLKKIEYTKEYYENSGSWKFTKPLRLLTNAFRNLLKIK